MDAQRMALVVCAGLVLMLGGCFTARTTPTFHKTEPATPGPELESEVVDAGDQPPDEAHGDVELVGQAVQGFIQRIDDVERRTQREPLTEQPEPWGAADRPLGAEVARASGPATTQPTPPVGRTPKEADQPTGTSVAAGAADQPEAAGGAGQAKPAAQDQPPAEPPALGDVSVAAQPAGLTPPALSAAIEPPGVNRAAVARQAPISLAQFLRQWPGDPEDTSFRQQLDLRVLRAMVGDYEGARQPLTMVSEEQQALAASFVASLIAIREAHDGDAAAAAGRVLTELEGLQAALRPLSELGIPTLALCREVRGYGDYEPIEPANFPAGVASEFVVYCELRDFVSQQEQDGAYAARFEMRTVILNRSGETMLEIRDPDIVDRCRQRRHDCFIARLVRLPATLSPGEYVAKVTVIDKLGEKLAESRATFRVVAGR